LCRLLLGIAPTIKPPKTLKPPIINMPTPLEMGDRVRESRKTDQILQGAMQEFLAKGYAAASMDRVALAAGVSKATVYSHFVDKETLFKTLVERMARGKMQAIMSHLDYSLEPRQGIRHLLTLAMEDCCGNQEFQDFKRMLVGVSGQFPELATTFVKHLSKPGIQALTQYFRDCPAFNFPDPEATARVVIGAIVNFGMLQKILHGAEVIPMEPERIVDALDYLLFPNADRAPVDATSDGKS
jgi:TetR/AcrR family transcriptional regulator, regulator of autoinduction and epiphytic fitness